MRNTIRRENALNQIVFIAPMLLCFIPIVIIPFLYALYMSFIRWNGISSVKTFVGFANFKQIFLNDREYWTAMLFSIKSTFTITLISNIMGLSFALLVCSIPRRIQGIARTLLLFPNIMSGVIMGFIWKFIFQKGFPSIAQITGLGFLARSWLADPQAAFWSITIVSCWQFAGYTMIIYIAGLMGISKEIHEASLIDGCPGILRFFKITLPLIMPSVTVCVFWVMVKTFTMYDLVSSLTEGGPFKTTMTVSMDLYAEAFTKNNYGLGSAKAILFFFLILAISSSQVAFTRSREVQY